MKTLTEAAQVAKIIKTELKKHGIKCSVTSENYSMGDSVRVNVYDLLPATLSKIQSFCNQYKSGDFDGMTDCYTYRDVKGPSAKYICVNSHYSDDIRQDAWDYLLSYYGDMDNAPKDFDKATNFYHPGLCMHGGTMINRLLSNDGPFWTARKPKIKAAA